MKLKLSQLSHRIAILIENYNGYIRIYYADGHYEIILKSSRDLERMSRKNHKYKNPIVSITINGKKISGRKFNKTDVIKLNYNTYKGKKNKITYQIKNGWSGNLAACDKNDSTLYGAVTADMSSETFTLQNGKGNFNLKFSLRDANGVENKVVIAFK